MLKNVLTMFGFMLYPNVDILLYNAVDGMGGCRNIEHVRNAYKFKNELKIKKINLPKKNNKKGGKKNGSKNSTGHYKWCNNHAYI